MWKSAGRAPVFASFTLAFALQLRKKHGKNLTQGKKNLSQVKKKLRVQFTYYQNTHTVMSNDHTVARVYGMHCLP
jgi:hypothetical protein